MPEAWDADGMVSTLLSDIFECLKTGKLALPELQRPSVWGNGKIPLLLDSVFRDYPFGTMLVWTPDPSSRIVSRRFAFDELSNGKPPASARHYLIDGQQRLTSFYRSIHDEATPDKPWAVRVAFNSVKEEFP